MAEHLTVAQVVVGSSPIIRPNSDLQILREFGGFCFRKLTNGHLEFRCTIDTCLRPSMFSSLRLRPNLL